MTDSAVFHDSVGGTYRDATGMLSIGGTIVWNETPAGTVDGLNDTFTLSNPPNPSDALLLYKNGLLMHAIEDFTLASDTITFDAAQIPQLGDRLVATYQNDA